MTLQIHGREFEVSGTMCIMEDGILRGLRKIILKFDLSFLNKTCIVHGREL